ncbi:MAG: hypothetical protein WAT16_06705, partial [Saprospiraceae bacterium]
MTKKTEQLNTKTSELNNQTQQSAENIKSAAKNIKSIISVFEPILSLKLKKMITAERQENTSNPQDAIAEQTQQESGTATPAATEPQSDEV